MEIKIYPYRTFSRGARALALYLAPFEQPNAKKPNPRKLLDINFFDEDGSVTTKNFMIVNWGMTAKKSFFTGNSNHYKFLNHPERVKLCNDKIRFFEHVKGSSVRVPDYTVDLEQAMKWLDEGAIVLGRSSRGSGGNDIKFFDKDPEEFVESDFFSKYKKKKEEYRIHIFNDRIICSQKKVLREFDDNGDPVDKSLVDFRIRNHTHGFIFQKHNIDPPADVIDQARAAIEKVGLAFGAVDVIWNEYEKKAYVLEVNTAPGLEGTTVKAYGDAILDFKNSLTTP